MLATLAGSAPGFADGGAHELHLPTAMLDDPARACPGVAFGSLFLLSGIGETLRVNSRVAAVDADWIRIAINECYGHCAKALIRSGLWSAQFDPAKLFVEHIKLNKATGVSATLASASLSVPGVNGLLKKGLEHDYKTKLYCRLIHQLAGVAWVQSVHLPLRATR